MEKVLHSAGGIVLNAEGKMILVCQHGNSWSFPKGKIEEGESEIETARREIREETGISELQLLKSLGSYERYSIGKDGVSENKEWGMRRRTLFLFTTKERTFAPQDLEEEITDARWVSIDEALVLLTHPKDREFLESMRNDITV